MSEEAATDVAKAPSLHENGEILTALTTTLRSFGSLPLEGGALAQAAFFRTNTKSKNISGWNETSLLVCLSTIRSNTFSTAGMDAGQSTRWKRRCATNQGKSLLGVAENANSKPMPNMPFASRLVERQLVLPMTARKLFQKS